MHKNATPRVTVVLINHAWHWVRLHTKYPGSAYLSTESFLSRWDAESAAAVVALCEDLPLKLPDDLSGQWAELALQQTAELDERTDADYRRKGW